VRIFILVLTTVLVATASTIAEENQLQQAKEAFARLGARHSRRTDWTTRQAFDAFDMPRSTSDEDLKAVPDVPFKFALCLDDSKVTGRGLTYLKRLPHLTHLELRYTSIGDGDLKALNGLVQLRGLDLQHTNVTDAGLKELSGLSQLEDLNLCGTQVTADGLKELKKNKRLNQLCVGEVSDATLAAIREIGLLHAPSDAHTSSGRRPKNATEVTILDLRISGVTDEGLKQLKELRNLEELNLAGTAVCGTGVKELRELKSLTRLYLGHSNVSDAGLGEVAKMTQLLELDFRGTAISDTGLKHLVSLTKLKKLYIGRPALPKSGPDGRPSIPSSFDRDRIRATEAGIRDLKKSLPNCEFLP
jgi:hypothetical protein